MIKRKYAVLFGAMCVSLLVACGKQGAENVGRMETQEIQETQKTQKTQETETDFLKKLEAANSGKNLLQKYEKAAFVSAYSYGDGTVVSQYNYADSKRTVVENDYYIAIDEQGDVYGFDNEEKKAYHVLFADGSYEPFIQAYRLELPSYTIDERETIVNREEKNGVIELSTSIVDKSFVDEIAATYLYGDGAVESLAYKYEIDAESYEITKSYFYAVLSDGKKVELYTCERAADPETYSVDGQIYSAVFEGDMRTVTLTENPGKEQEKVYTQTVSKGNVIQVCLPPEHSGELYLDAACTTLYEGGADNNADLDVYYIK